MTRPCIRPDQRSLPAHARIPSKRHRWKRGVCTRCGLKKEKARVDACACGCRTPIYKDTTITQLGRHRFVFGHETLDLFDDAPVA
jgi:hypothetical protein